MQAVGKFTCTRGGLAIAAIHIQRQADNQGFRFPLFQKRGDIIPVGLGIFAREGFQWCGGAQQLVAAGHADLLCAVIEGQNHKSN